jgi:hypothetical protein
MMKYTRAPRARRINAMVMMTHGLRLSRRDPNGEAVWKDAGIDVGPEATSIFDVW